MRSNLQAAIRSLSFFACRCREITFRLPCFVILPRISSIALRSGRKRNERATLMRLADATHLPSCLIASHTESLRSSSLFSPSPRLRATQTSAHASPSST